MSSQLGPASTCTSSSGRGLFPSSLPFAFTLLINKLLVLEVKVARTCLCARVAVQQEQPGVLNAADGGVRNSVSGGQSAQGTARRGRGPGRGRARLPCTGRVTVEQAQTRQRRSQTRTLRSADAWLINSSRRRNMAAVTRAWSEKQPAPPDGAGRLPAACFSASEQT